MSQIESIIARIKGFFQDPKQEWEIISNEEKTTSIIFKSFLFPLSIISAFACYIGYGIVGSEQGKFGKIATAKLGYSYAALTFITLIASIFLTALLIPYLAKPFKAEKDFGKAFKLVVYSYTPTLAAGLFYIVPALSPLVLLAGLYTFYLLYLGLKPITHIPDDKTKIFYILILATTIFVYLIISLLVTPVIFH